MCRAMVLWACFLFGCAPTGESAPTASLKQAVVVGTPTVEGAPGAELGATMAACPDGGFVAGAPGISTAWVSWLGLRAPAVGNQLGRAVTCAPGPNVFAGGNAGIRKLGGTGWSNFSSSLVLGPVLSIASSTDPDLPLAVSTSSEVIFVNVATGMTTGQINNAPGMRVYWFPGQPRLAVAHAQRVVKVYDYDRSNHSTSVVMTIMNPNQGNVAGFGRAFAVGELIPPAGPELAIGADNEVFIYAMDAGLLMQISGPGPSFGASLAIDQNAGNGTDALMVGQPDSDRVFRFIGDAGEVAYSGNSGMGRQSLGASLAIDSTRKLAMGAPSYSSTSSQGGGAVYVEQLPNNSLIGESQPCTANATCVTQDCMSGRCIGGVFCDTSDLKSQCNALTHRCVNGQCFPFLSTNDGGSFDAGRPFDAGLPFDAGPSRDAGAEDAGMMDAGTSDAGAVDAGASPADGGSELLFSTAGCSGTGVWPMMGLFLMLVARRRRV